MLRMGDTSKISWCQPKIMLLFARHEIGPSHITSFSPNNKLE